MESPCCVAIQTNNNFSCLLFLFGSILQILYLTKVKIFLAYPKNLYTLNHSMSISLRLFEFVTGNTLKPSDQGNAIEYKILMFRFITKII